MSTLQVTGGLSYVQVLDQSAVSIAVVEPATTFTSITVDDNGGKARLTGAGTHALTEAVSVTPGDVNIYISAGAGWTVGLHKINSIDMDTTGVAITLDTDYDVAMGSPTVSLAGEDVPLINVFVPPLGANSQLALDYTCSGTSSGNNKVWRVSFGGTNFVGVVTTTSPVLTHRFAIANRGSTNSQTGSMNTSNNTGYGVGSALPITASIDTSVPTILSIIGDPASANEVVRVERFWVDLRA